MARFTRMVAVHQQNEGGRLSLVGSLTLDRRTWNTLLALSLD